MHGTAVKTVCLEYEAFPAASQTDKANSPFVELLCKKKVVFWDHPAVSQSFPTASLESVDQFPQGAYEHIITAGHPEMCCIIVGLWM